MSFGPGTHLGPYEIVSAIGAGGMGEVYRATDTNLGRVVAIKVLPEAFAQDPERVARFEREAKTLASLNHPNIAIIHGLEKSRGICALVMELVEGEDLSQRIARGPIPIDEALPIARQIADALEAAHEQGVIHRDLKPANIKVRPDGTVKVLDFGLAKLAELSAVSTNPSLLSLSPTITSPALMTGVGTLLGTAAYMSPEQAKGKEVDRTADVWAFGCVLYEMLSGRSAFAGGTVSEVLAEILKTEPDWSRLPAATPDPVRRLLRRALCKERKHRLQHIGDARIELEDAQGGQDAPHVQRAPTRRGWIAWTAVVVLTLIAVGLGVRGFRPDPLPPREVRLEVTTPPAANPTSFAISPDGQAIVFEGTTQGRTQLWLRALNEVTPAGLAGTDGAAAPFWSPDGRSIGFFADGKLKRLDLNGRSVQTLAKAVLGYGGRWNHDGAIRFAQAVSPIRRISQKGGDPVAVTRLSPQQTALAFPQFLPDGRHFLYFALGSGDARGVYVGQIDGVESRRLFDADGPARYTSSGHLLFARQATLIAQPFDPAHIQLTGNSFPFVEHFAMEFDQAAVSTSPAGPIAYRRAVDARRQLVWLDRSGRELSRIADQGGTIFNLAASPDGQQLAVQRFVSGTPNDIWLLQLERGTFVRFTSNPWDEVRPLWSPDGSRIVFGSGRRGPIELVWKSVTGGEDEEPLVTSPSYVKSAMDWSPDGKFLLYRIADPKSGFDLWALPMVGERKPFPVVQTDFDEREAQFSPDGKWIAYQSNESGRFEVYVRPFPGPGRTWAVSTQGGSQVRWRADGRELFYLALDGRLMAVSLRLAADDRTVDADPPVPLFATRVGAAVDPINGHQYIASGDGQRFLMNMVTDEATSAPIVVILNMKGPNQ